MDPPVCQHHHAAEKLTQPSEENFLHKISVEYQWSIKKETKNCHVWTRKLHNPDIWCWKAKQVVTCTWILWDYYEPIEILWDYIMRLWAYYEIIMRLNLERLQGSCFGKWSLSFIHNTWRLGHHSTWKGYDQDLDVSSCFCGWNIADHVAMIC